MVPWPFKRHQRSFDVGAGSSRLETDDLTTRRRTRTSRKLSRRSQQPQGVRRIRRKRDRDSTFPTSNLPPRISSSILESIHGNHIINLYDFEQHHARQSDTSFPSNLSLEDTRLDYQSIEPTLTQKPRRKTNIFRRLSRRESKERSSPYTFRLGRRDSIKNKHERYLGDFDRSQPSRSSVESDVSRRAYKIRSRDVFSPCPTLHYEDASSFWSGKSRDTSRSHTRTPRSLLQEGHIRDRNVKIDELADVLDEAGLREVMERDRRNREKRKSQHEERVRLKQEKKAIRLQGQIYHQISNPGPSAVPTAVLQDPRTGHAISGTQTPVSWLNDDSSAEDVSHGQVFVPRMDVITPESMVLSEDQVVPVEESVVADESPTKTSPSPANFEPTTDAQPDETARSTDKRQSIIYVRTGKAREKLRSGWRSLFTGSKVKKPKPKQKQKARRNSNPAQSTSHLSSQDDINHPFVNPLPDTYLVVQSHQPQQEQPSDWHQRLVPIATPSEILRFEQSYNNENNEDNFDDQFRDFDYTAAFDPPSNQSFSSLNLQESELRDGPTPIPMMMDESGRDSPTIPPHHVCNHPEHTDCPAHSEISDASLATIDSEGNWLAGKLKPPQQTIQQVAPLRASASLLRRRYTELTDVNDGSVSDRYFTGVASTIKPEDEDNDAVFDDDAASISSEVERNMWRDGVQKKVELNSTSEKHKSTVGILDEFGDEAMEDVGVGVAR